MAVKARPIHLTLSLTYLVMVYRPDDVGEAAEVCR